MSYDLTKVGPVREDVLVMVKDVSDGCWHGPYDLVGIEDNGLGGYRFVVLNAQDYYYSYAKLYEPPVKRPMTHAEIFKAIREGAVVRIRHLPGCPANEVWNQWCTAKRINAYQICYNYTDTEADVWEEMEVEGE